MKIAVTTSCVKMNGGLAIDSLNSKSTPSGVWTEWLLDGSDLLNWLEQARAIETEAAAKYRAGNDPEHVLDGITEQARSLRGWFRLFVVRHAGRDLGADAVAELAPLNQLLAGDDSYRQVEAEARRSTHQIDAPSVDAEFADGPPPGNSCSQSPRRSATWSATPISA